MASKAPRFVIKRSLLAILLAFPAQQALAANCTWTAAAGNWNALANWLGCATGNGNPAGTPGGADTAVIGGGGTVTVSTSQAIRTLDNAGVVNVNDNLSFSFDARSAAAGFSGGGQLVLGGPGSRLFVEGANGVTVGSGSTIRGAGQIGQAVQQSGASIFTNNGTLSADVNGQSLMLLRPANSGSYQNNALMEARNGGTLHLSNSAVTQGASGVLRAENGSTVLIANTSVANGTLASAGTGAIRASNSNANLLRNTTITGVVDMLPAGQLRLANDTLLSGRIDVGGSSNLYIDNRTSQGLAGTQSINGAGSIALAGGALRVEGTGQTTLGSGVTVAGHGAFGQAIIESGNHTLINNGLITANAAGQTLFIQPMANGSQAIQNNGVMEAANGGLLALQTNITGGATSQLRALAGSTIRLDGVTVNGTVNTAGGGTITALNTNANLLSGVALNGTLSLDAGAAQMRIGNSLVLNGSIGVGGSSNLYIDNRAGLAANQSITGSGSIDLSGGGLRMEGAGTTSTTVGPNIVVRGFGTAGQAIIQSTAMTLVNDGTFSADVNGQTLVLQTPGNSGVWSNQALLEARNGGTLRLDGNVIQSGAGRIVAEAGSTVLLNAVSIDGGVVGTAGGGTFQATNTNVNLLSNVRLDGVLVLGGFGSQTRIANNAVINGRIDVGNLGNLYIDNRTSQGLAGTQSITGSGSIVLAGGALRVEGAGQTTIGSGVTVAGHGAFGQAIIQSGNHTLINNGRISADVSGNTLAIQTPANNGTWVNQALMDARNGGTLRLDGSVSQSASGVLRAENGSTVFMNGVTVSGGVLDSAGTGTFQASNTNLNLLSDVRLEGVLQLGGFGAQARIANNAVINGRIDVANFGHLYLDSRAPASANQTLSGSGLINMGGGVVRIEGSGQTTIASGLTLAGHGTVGQAVLQSGTHTLVNNGTISASTAGQTLTLQQMANNGGITGTGTLQVAGGTLSVATGQATQQGRLVIGNAGTLATNNRHITLSADYTSDQWGSGNGFDRRAAVTGTGQILAGGDVSQVITGANITNGNTANATLTLGNVRVGDNTFNYQIGNAGNTGPTLRGAIQTAANGGNISDARLSGSGVTASNYNAGGPGANSGDLAVVFNAASAGALAPLAGQVLNLRSNFENIADQKLNIVLAGGAAAYNAAVGATTPSPIVVGNQRVGGGNLVGLLVANTAAAGAFSEDLRASFGANGGAALNNGAVATGIVAGGNSAGVMGVGVNTATAGAKSGTVQINYETLGTVSGVSNNLGVAGANPEQTINVSGNVYQLAAGALQTGPLNFGTLQVGQQVSRNLVVRNTASGATGFVEDLNASFGASGNSQISGSGALNGILAGTDSTAANGAMTVTVTGATAGGLNSSIAVNYFSAGAVNSVSNGLGVLAVGSENFAVNGTITATGNVINQANPQINTPTINLAARRVGDSAATANVSVSNVAGAPPQAALNASISSGGAPVTASGSFNLLGPGATSTALQVGLNTAVAGDYTGANAGSATIALISDANNVGNCAPNCQINLAPQTVSVSGKVYTAAVGQSTTPVVDFGRTGPAGRSPPALPPAASSPRATGRSPSAWRRQPRVSSARTQASPSSARTRTWPTSAAAPMRRCCSRRRSTTSPPRPSPECPAWVR